MLDLIREGWDRLVRFFSGGEEVTATEEPETGTAPVLAESSPSGILVEPISITSESERELQEEPPDLSHWKVMEYTESPFEKCGRLYIEGDDLVIRSDLDVRGFCIPLVEIFSSVISPESCVGLVHWRSLVQAKIRGRSGISMNSPKGLMFGHLSSWTLNMVSRWMHCSGK